jgi:hypothetical protein
VSNGSAGGDREERAERAERLRPILVALYEDGEATYPQMAADAGVELQTLLNLVNGLTRAPKGPNLRALEKYVERKRTSHPARPKPSRREPRDAGGSRAKEAIAVLENDEAWVKSGGKAGAPTLAERLEWALLKQQRERWEDWEVRELAEWIADLKAGSHSDDGDRDGEGRPKASRAGARGPAGGSKAGRARGTGGS